MYEDKNKSYVSQKNSTGIFKYITIYLLHVLHAAMLGTWTNV